MMKSIEPLLVKFLTNNANREELLRLEKWIHEKGNKSLFLKYIKVNVAINKIMGKYNKEDAKKSFLLRIKQERSLYQKNNKVYTWLKYAAAVIIVFGLGYFFGGNIFNSQKESVPVIVNTSTILPGTDKATLTLEDESVVYLTNGESFQTQNANSDGEKIIYASPTKKTKELAYNYLTVPRGGQFHIVLSDGTEVWLNSESQLKYPVSFIEEEPRQVELVYGEAYFDVSPSSEHDGSRFKVLNKSQEVEVLGTEFNIKAYKDETNIYTTLVEGKVDVWVENINQGLTPNQQLNLDTSTNISMINIVDVYNEISWREGVFSFDGKTLKEMMKMLSRWHNVDIVFKDKTVENVEFVGVLRKNQKIEGILNNIKNFGIIKNFKVEDGKIVIE